MSKHKSIPTATRKKLYEKYNHRCAYCGCELEYKDMQIDHVESVYRNNDIAQTMSEKEMYDESNLLPACRQCNFYKSTFTIEQFRQRLKNVMMPNLQKISATDWQLNTDWSRKQIKVSYFIMKL